MVISLSLHGEGETLHLHCGGSRKDSHSYALEGAAEECQAWVRAWDCSGEERQTRFQPSCQVVIWGKQGALS